METQLIQQKVAYNMMVSDFDVSYNNTPQYNEAVQKVELQNLESNGQIDPQNANVMSFNKQYSSLPVYVEDP